MCLLPEYWGKKNTGKQNMKMHNSGMCHFSKNEIPFSKSLVTLFLLFGPYQKIHYFWKSRTFCLSNWYEDIWNNPGQYIRQTNTQCHVLCQFIPFTAPPPLPYSSPSPPLQCKVQVHLLINIPESPGIYTSICNTVW